MNNSSVAAASAADIVDAGGWLKLIGGLAIAFALFQALGHWLGSVRGQAGLVIAGAVVVALLAVEYALFARAPLAALRSLGFGAPAAAGMIAALAASALLLATIPLYAAARSAAVSLYPGWAWLLPGLFAQAGIAEEALFRGYLFARLRAGRTFWHAALLSTLPFVLVHLILFATMPWPVALAAILLSAGLSFPLARLFELGGNTIWPPAVVHFTVQGAIKVVEAPGDAALPLVWMAASAAFPYLAFLFRLPTASLQFR